MIQRSCATPTPCTPPCRVRRVHRRYGLADQAQAQGVRVRDGAPVVTDGPYIEAKEYLASFTLVDCETEERALEIAARDPAARFGQVELWPILHEAGVEM